MGRSHVRLRVGLIVIAMLLSLFGARLFQLQGVDSKAYAARADGRRAGHHRPAGQARPDPRPQRRRRSRESVAGLMIVADPTRTTPHAEAIAKILADRLDLDYFDLLAKLTKKNAAPGSSTSPAGSPRRWPPA